MLQNRGQILNFATYSDSLVTMPGSQDSQDSQDCDNGWAAKKCREWVESTVSVYQHSHCGCFAVRDVGVGDGMGGVEACVTKCDVLPFIFDLFSLTHWLSLGYMRLKREETCNNWMQSILESCIWFFPCWSCAKCKCRAAVVQIVSH